jgi:hypothetical protein
MSDGLSESERAIVLDALRFTAHILRQRCSGRWRVFHRLAVELERRCPSADIEATAVSHDGFMTTRDVAEHLGISERHARRRASELGAQRHGHAWAIPRDALEETTTCH